MPVAYNLGHVPSLAISPTSQDECLPTWRKERRNDPTAQPDEPPRHHLRSPSLSSLPTRFVMCVVPRASARRMHPGSGPGPGQRDWEYVSEHARALRVASPRRPDMSDGRGTVIPLCVELAS